MAASVSNSRLPSSRNFDRINDSTLQSDELPLTGVLDNNQWQKSSTHMKLTLAKTRKRSTRQRLRYGR